MIKSGFFNSQNKDRLYNADDMSSYFKGLISQGVVLNLGESFVVKENNKTMTIKIGTGRAYFENGKFVESNAQEVLPIEAAEIGADRIDRIVLRCNNNIETRDVSLIVKKGTPDASNPVAPTLTKENGIYELSLAEVAVKRNTTGITQAMITDERGNEKVCGFVKGLIEQLSSEGFFLQMQAMFDDWFARIQNEITSFVTVTQKTHLITTSGTTTNIPIPASMNYSDLFDIMEIYVNGLRLTHSEFTVNGKESVTLKNALPKNQKVELVVLHPAENKRANPLTMI